MAELVIELAESRSESVLEARPLDDLEISRPDITWRGDVSGRECEGDLRGGLGRASKRDGSQLQEAVAR